jgi:hypothetical protein
MQRAPTTPEARLQWLVDRAEIQDLQAEYGRCLDDKDFIAWQALFTEDAYLHMPYESIAQPDLPAAAHRVLDHYPKTQHLLAQSYIEIDGDTARGRRYLAAAHVPEHAADDSVHADLGGWYEHEYRRTADGWRFTSIRATFIWLGGEPFEVFDD